MKKLNLILTCLPVFALLVVPASTLAQFPQPGPEFDYFKKEVGEWECEIKLWQAPGSEPSVSKGWESNRMLGGHWMITDFKGKMMGMDFAGHGTYSYDSNKKTYVGSWIDSFSPNVMHMTGKWDESTQTMTYTGQAPGMDGNPATHELVIVHKDGGRAMTMWVQPQGGEKAKAMEITYAKKK